MKRLTVKIEHENYGQLWFKQCIGCKENCYYCSLQKNANSKLAAYEDTGLTPERVAELLERMKKCECGKSST